MSVDLEPAELDFRRPFNQEITQTLHLRNPHPDPVAFKVKTTAPRRYCVRPNSGRIEPVLLQAMKDEPSLDAKCRDKFLVQSVAVSADKEFSNWQDVEKTAKPSIQERKIRVNFLPPLDATQPNGVPSEDESTALHTSPGNTKFETPSMPTRAAPVIAEPPIEPPNFVQERQEPNSPPSEVSKQVPEDTKPGPSRPSAGENDDLRSQLEKARAQIQQLKQQVAENELRQRKVATKGGASPELATLQQQSHPPAEMGVPLKVVAGLCLISFLLAYIFF
ncbi:phosphatidylinositol-binding protein scs2 [Emydomyces testavorans]|uniref:Phosphatidylinositol-binding protein scs2 n=1 Tax=Emydomyces testavorans TaxID=2070801 RepID=A0AAF0IGC2_9EURO|nr:phosphatidylinositol-binding protein scs2 [Emydomyces testavorans]